MWHGYLAWSFLALSAHMIGHNEQVMSGLVYELTIQAILEFIEGVVSPSHHQAVDAHPGPSFGAYQSPSVCPSSSSCVFFVCCSHLSAGSNLSLRTSCRLEVGLYCDTTSKPPASQRQRHRLVCSILHIDSKVHAIAHRIADFPPPPLQSFFMAGQLLPLPPPI